MPARFRPQWIVVLLAIAVPLAFACFTDHAWEDYFITLRSSRNLVEGHGLVFNVGERVHTFTSPLGVLVPALCTWVVGLGHEERALWLFRLIDIALLGVAAWLVWRRTETLRLGRLGQFLLFGFVIADAKLADFAINGMETAMLVFFLLLLWTELESPDRPRVWPFAVAVAGLMWTRPDAFILGGAVIVPHLIFRARSGGTSRLPWRPVFGGLLLGGALYLPWFAWAWWYYGSPIPHTVVAKAAVTTSLLDPTAIALTPWQTLIGGSSLKDVFLPTYWVFGGWPSQLRYFSYVCTIVSSFAWLVPGLPGVARRLSLAMFIGSFYLGRIIPFPWYWPPWTVLAALAIAFTADHAHAKLVSKKDRGLAAGLRIACALVVAIQVAVLIGSAWQLRTQQQLVENRVRRDIGRWLGRTATHGDSVLLEPLGYIGYYSQLKTYDLPGLSAPEVVRAMRRGNRSFSGLVAEFRPTWLVLRPHEFNQRAFAERPELRPYKVIAYWDARPQLDAIRFLPGRQWLEYDSRFIVLQRQSSPTATTDAPSVPAAPPPGAPSP